MWFAPERLWNKEHYVTNNDTQRIILFHAMEKASVYERLFHIISFSKLGRREAEQAI